MSGKNQPGTALAPVARDEQANFMPVLTIEDAIRRRNLMVEYTRQLMQEGRDFGKIPGTDKATLLKPGAEKLCTIFGLCVENPEVVEKVEDWTGKDHEGESFFYYLVRQRLTRNGVTIASQMGSCNSWEKKYRFRNADRVCPKCGKPAIKRSKYTPRDQPDADPGWYCFAKMDGCGANFYASDPAIVSQHAGKVPNPEISDVVNTVLKMACKRALIAAVLVATNASEFYTQDAEDMAIIDVEYEEAPRRQEHAQPARPANGTHKPAPAKSAHSLPANGSELQKRLTDYDAKLASQKVCAPGALLKHVRESGAKAGYEGSIETWSGPAIQFAVEQTKVFEAECRKQPAQAD